MKDWYFDLCTFKSVQHWQWKTFCLLCLEAVLNILQFKYCSSFILGFFNCEYFTFKKHKNQAIKKYLQSNIL